MIDRKVWAPSFSAPGIAVIATFGIVAYARSKGIEIPDTVQVEITAVVTGIFGFVVGVLVPMASNEIKRHLAKREDANEIVAEVAADPASQVDLSKIITNEDVMKAQLDPTSPVTMPEGVTIVALEKKLDDEQIAGGQ